MRLRRLVIGATWAVACLCGACAQDHASLRMQLESYDPAMRVQALMKIAELGDRTQLAALVDRLDDGDPAVRFYAILVLERLTNTRLGYSYASPAPVRREAIGRWRRYVQEQAATAEPAD